jgi:hypothetical protein
VQIAVLLIAIPENRLNPFTTQSVMVVKNPGKENMEFLIKEGKEPKQFKASGQIGEEQGVKAGVACRLKDGSMIYVQEAGDAK